MKKIIAAVLSALVIASVLSGCSAPKPTKTLTVGVLPDVDSVPLIIAQHNGYFEQEGLDINIEKFTSARDRDSALQAGTLDGAVSDMLAAAFFTQGNFEVKMTSMTNGSYKLLAGTSMGESDNLSGKTIAISTNTIIEYATDRMLTELGITAESVEKTAIPQIPTRLEMLKSGQVDSATLPEPLASSAVLAGARIISSTDKLGINPGVLLFAKQATESKNAEIQAFYRAYNKAVDYLNDAQLSEYVDILISELSFPEDVKDIITLPSYTHASSPSEEDFNSVIDWLYGKSLIENKYSYYSLFDGDFIK